MTTARRRRKPHPVEQLTSDVGRLVEIPVGDVVPSPDNPRRDLGDLDGLTDSIRQDGILEPLIVVPSDGGRFEIVAGHRRHAATVAAGFGFVPCIVRDYDDPTVRTVRLVENLHREDLDPLEEAAAFRQLVDLGLSQRDIARRVGCTQPHVSKRLELLDLPKPAAAALVEGRLTIEDALALAKLARRDRKTATSLARRRLGKNDGPSYLLRGDIERAHGDLDAAENRTKALAELADRQLTVIDLPDVEPFQTADRLPDGAVPLEGPRSVDLDPDAHTSEPCHAIAVLKSSRYDPAPRHVAVCTDPSRHGTVKARADREAAQRRAEADADQARQDALSAAAVARDRAAAVAVRRTRKGTKDELLESLTIAAALLLAATYHQDRRRALELLDGDTVTDDVDLDARLAEIVGTDGAGAARLVDALYAAHTSVETTNQARWHGRITPAGRDYLAWLRRHAAYEPTDVERELLDGDQAAG